MLGHIGSLRRLSVLFCLWALFSTSLATHADEIHDTIRYFIEQQTAAYSGEVNYTIGSTDAAKKLPVCSGFQAFLPNGSSPVGNTTIGVRCLMPNQWSIYVPVKIRISGNYQVTARPIAAGHPITAADLAEATGDLTTLPTGTVQRKEQIIGKSARFALASGQPIRQEQLMAPIIVKQNQSVRLTVGGTGFKASAEGKSLSNGAEGQAVQVRTPSGTTVTGIVQPDGTVLVNLGQ